MPIHVCRHTTDKVCTLEASFVKLSHKINFRHFSEAFAEGTQDSSKHYTAARLASPLNLHHSVKFILTVKLSVHPEVFFISVLFSMLFMKVYSEPWLF